MVWNKSFFNFGRSLLFSLSQKSALILRSIKNLVLPCNRWREEKIYEVNTLHRSSLVTFFTLPACPSFCSFFLTLNDYLLVADRALFIWSTKDFPSKEHKNLRHNIEFDHASHVCWSPDSKAFIINRATENVLEVYKVPRKPDGWIASVTKAITFPKVV